MLCDPIGAYEFTLPKAPEMAFDEIWKQAPVAVAMSGLLGLRRQGEAICYRPDGRAILATSEGAPCPLFEMAQAP